MPVRDDSGAAGIGELRRLLGELLGCAVDTIVEQRGRGQGTGGRSFVAEAGGRALHVKLVTAGSLRTLPVADELALLRSLQSVGIAPAPVAADPERGLLVTELLVGCRPLADNEAGRPEAIAAIAGLAARLHAAHYGAAARPLRTIAGEYLDRTDEPMAAGSAAPPLAVELIGLAEWFDAWPEPPAVCHGDLVAANILCPADAAADRAGVSGWRLVDFEYALLAPPVWDLASVSVMNGYAAMQDAALLRHYYATQPMPFSAGDFAKVRRLVALIAHFWSHAQTARSERPVASGIGRYRLDTPANTD